MSRRQFYSSYYKTYVENYNKVKRNYAMSPKLSYEEYKEIYVDAKSLGLKNISNEIVSRQIKFSRAQANEYMSKIDALGLRGKEIDVYNDEEEYVGKLKIDDVEDITKMRDRDDRATFFHYLRTLGYSYAQAREIYDEKMLLPKKRGAGIAWV